MQIHTCRRRKEAHESNEEEFFKKKKVDTSHQKRFSKSNLGNLPTWTTSCHRLDSTCSINKQRNNNQINQLFFKRKRNLVSDIHFNIDIGKSTVSSSAILFFVFFILFVCLLLTFSIHFRSLLFSPYLVQPHCTSPSSSPLSFLFVFLLRFGFSNAWFKQHFRSSTPTR